MCPRAGAPAPHGSSAERHLHAPAQPCGTRPSKASPHPLSILCTARPFSGARSTVGALSFAFPSPWPEIRGPAWALVPAQLLSTPLSSGAIITGRHEAGDKPRNSPQPFLMGQLELSPRKKKERLWLELQSHLIVILGFFSVHLGTFAQPFPVPLPSTARSSPLA